MPDAPPPPPRHGRSVLLGMSLMLNLLVLVAVVGVVYFFSRSGEDTDALTRKHLFGKKHADNRIAVIHLDGPLMEGLLGYAEKQIEQAAADKKVKAVVLRINSPGGSITASDQLHHRLVRLRDGVPEKNASPKPLVVSMASLAASGGYYVAMPARVLYAERTTLTGSIGVYASFPNVRDLADKVGVQMTIVSRGDVKTAGSPFRDMRPEERALWQAMVDHAYEQFKQVVEEGRPDLKGKLEEKVIDEKRSVHVDTKDGATETKEVPYVRRRADGGIFTADQAKRFGLIDRIGYLEDAVKEAAEQAGLGDNYEAIEYEKPFNLTEALLGLRAPQGQVLPDAARLAEGLTPRLWYLAPQAELSGLVAATQERR